MIKAFENAMDRAMKPLPPLVIYHTESHRSWGGQESRVLNECLWMRLNGHRPLLAAPPQSQIHARATKAGLTVRGMRFTNLTAVADLIRLRSDLKRCRPDVLNTHGNMDAKVGLLASRGLDIPCVIRSRHHSHPVSPSRFNTWMYRHLSEYIFTTANAISDQIVTDLAVDPEKVITVASGFIPPDGLPDRETARGQIQHELGLDPHSRFIGSVAMLRDWKGHHFLLDAFTDIRDRFPDHHLIIVGDGDEMEPLKARSARNGLSNRVHFTGFRSDPWPFFSAFDVNVLASTKNEGIPQVLLQAMYAQCPVIGTRVGGIPDVVTHGVSGWLVEPGDASALASALTEVLTDPLAASQRAAYARHQAAQHHTIDAMGQRILTLYARAFKRHSGRSYQTASDEA